MASQLPPKINTAYTFYVSLVSQADTKTFQANPTLATGDVKVAIDDGAPANLATLPVVDADYTKRVKVALSSAEMNGDNITVIFSDASGAEWCDLTVNLQTVTNQFDDLATSTALATAQTDLDTLTGSDGATLATSQPNYAPATAAALATAQADLDAILEDTDITIPALIAALNDLSEADIRAAVGLASANLDTQIDALPTAAEINAEIVDALATDTYAEPSSVPAATATLAAKIGWLYLLARNRITQTATTGTVYADDGTTDVAESSVSDDGSTFVRGEWS